MAEYDRLGQDRFLEKYGFGAARSYWLVIDGKTYDSKAIVGDPVPIGNVLQRNTSVRASRNTMKHDIDDPL